MLITLQEAWGLANDSLKTTLCVRFRSLTIACACIFLAARRLGIAMPEDPPWWEMADTSFEDMATVCEEIVALHGLPKPVYISVNKGETAASVDAKTAASNLKEIENDNADAGNPASPQTQSQPQSSGPAAMQPSEARVRTAGASSPSGSVQGGSQGDPANGAAHQRHKCDTSRQESAVNRHDRDDSADRREREGTSSRRDRDDAHRHKHGRKSHKESSKSSRSSRRKGYPDGYESGRSARDAPRDRSDSSRALERGSRDRHLDSGSRRGEEPSRLRGQIDGDRGRSRSGPGGRRRDADHRSSPLRRSPIVGTNGQGNPGGRMQNVPSGGTKSSSIGGGGGGQEDDSLPGPPAKPGRTPLNWEEMTAKRRLDLAKAPKRRADPEDLSNQAEKVHRSNEKGMMSDRGDDSQ